MIATTRALITAIACLIVAVACGGDNSQPAGPVLTNTGTSCTADNQCFAALDGATLLGGAPLCLTRTTPGYCTHHCGVDTDCCAVAGECGAGLHELCAPFESTGDMYCFLSCEQSLVTQAGLTDSNAYCQQFANRAFLCRSTGGGAKQRKVCLPG
jgi:hypothetical protein